MSMLQNNYISRTWNYLFVELADPRTNDWPLMRNPIPGLTIIILYLYFVLNWGPKMMMNRKPFRSKPILIAYNAFQMIFSMFLVYESLDGAWLWHYRFKCEPIDNSVNAFTMRVCRGFYLYFLAKLTELMDTVFFVLRKKESQLTFLHVYHHTCMPMIAWGATKYYPGGHESFIGMVNSMVHVFMYLYYLLAAMGPKYYKYLWWKKYITIMQMGQFAICFYHSMQLLWVPCNYPKWSVVFTLPNAVFFFYLFYDFYYKAYSREISIKSDIKMATLKTIIENNNNDVKSD